MFGVLFDGRWLIIFCVLIFSITGLATSLLSTPIYKADALIQIEQRGGAVSSLISDGLGEILNPDSSSATEIELIKSRMVLGKTVDNLDLAINANPIYKPIIGKGLARLKNQLAYIELDYLEVPSHWQNLQDNSLKVVQTDQKNQSYKLVGASDQTLLVGSVGSLAAGSGYEILISHLDGTMGQEYSVFVSSRVDVIRSLQGRLSISERGTQTGILQLSMEGESKQEIETILNDISTNYFLQNVKRQSAEAEKSLEFLNNHLPEIKINLTHAEDVLNQFRQENESVDLNLEAQSSCALWLT